jgi:hypothetical protein
VREIVIVIGDLYLGPELTARSAADASALEAPPPASPVSGAGQSADAMPGIEHVARFGDEATLPEGWRAWAARWLGMPQYAREPPASVAAAALADVPAERAVWIATPMHLIAGMTSLHFDRRSVLRLPGAELNELAADFRDTFRGSGFGLHPLEGGEFLLSGPPLSAPSITTEPARMLQTSVAEALPAGEGAPPLRRREAPPVATLWVWGGGAPALTGPTPSREIADAAYGSDAYVRGLWRLAGGESSPMPVDWAAVIGEPRAQRALGVVEVAELLHANASWRLADAVAEIDRRLISPSLAALRRGELERLALLANDRHLSVRAADRWRLWRHTRTVRRGLEALT